MVKQIHKDKRQKVSNKHIHAPSQLAYRDIILPTQYTKERCLNQTECITGYTEFWNVKTRPTIKTETAGLDIRTNLKKRDLLSNELKIKIQ